MNIQHTKIDVFQKIMVFLGILAGLSLFGYALVNLIRMPDVNPGAFVPNTLEQPSGSSFGLFQLVFVLGFSFAFLPVSVMFTVKRYAENPHAMILGGSLLCLALIIEIINNLPFLGMYIYPERLTNISPFVMLYLNQMAAIRYLSFDVAGFTILYTALLIYAVVYWNSKRILSYLIIASVIIFTASAPLLWVSGKAAVVFMAISVFCLVPVPVLFGRVAVEQ